jgi:hypothetical protein
MKWQYTRLFEHLPFLSDPSKHLTTYLGPELVDQVNWPTAAYWNMDFAPGWSADGVKLTNSGLVGFAIKSFFSPISVYYQCSIIASNTGKLDAFHESPGRVKVNYNSLFILNTVAPHPSLELYSNPFTGHVTYLSVKRILNY